MCRERQILRTTKPAASLRARNSRAYCANGSRDSLYAQSSPLVYRWNFASESLYAFTACTVTHFLKFAYNSNYSSSRL